MQKFIKFFTKKMLVKEGNVIIVVSNGELQKDNEEIKKKFRVIGFS